MVAPDPTSQPTERNAPAYAPHMLIAIGGDGTMLGALPMAVGDPGIPDVESDNRS